jgi:hypothetical protein
MPIKRDPKPAEKPAGRPGARPAAKAPAPAAPPPPSGLHPANKPVGKLPPDAQQALRNFYEARPQIDLPEHLHELQGTLGYYYGDGRPERELVIGFKPAYVLFTFPPYQESPLWVDDAFKEPPLHEQPPMTDRGFRVVGMTFNQPNGMYRWIAWKAPSP